MPGQFRHSQSEATRFAKTCRETALCDEPCIATCVILNGVNVRAETHGMLASATSS